EDPGTFSMDEHGVVGTAVRQQTHYGYDLSGRMISTTDAYGHSVTRDILANTGYGGEDAQVNFEYHEDGGYTENRYDVFGDLRQSFDGVGDEIDYTYDKMGRLIQ